VNRIYLGVGLALALAGLGWFGYRTAYQGGYKAAEAVVRSEWHLERARAAEAAREAEARIYARHQEVERELDAKLDAATRRGADLARRLRTQACPLPGAAHDTAAAVDGAAGVTGDAGEVGAALADHLAACERDAARFAELQGLVR
jgi:methylmalonyl-CoA mutase N-terminal domain/subunit